MSATGAVTLALTDEQRADVTARTGLVVPSLTLTTAEVVRAALAADLAATDAAWAAEGTSVALTPEQAAACRTATGVAPERLFLPAAALVRGLRLRFREEWAPEGDDADDELAGFRVRPFRGRRPDRAADGPDVLHLEVPSDGVAVFGTGTHPTTRLTAGFVRRVVAPGASVLDVGTGSGILAIASARLGAASVLGIEVHEPAAAVATRNVVANGLAGSVVISTAPVHAVEGCFDVVVANLLADLVLELLPALRDRTADGGHLVVSGFKDERADDVAAAAVSSGFAEIDRASELGWSSLLLVRAAAGGAATA